MRDFRDFIFFFKFLPNQASNKEARPTFCRTYKVVRVGYSYYFTQGQ